MIQVTTTGATTADFLVIDAVINMETKRKVSRVMGSEHYGIMTACIIDGEFVLVSNYEVSPEMHDKLMKA
jgi:hypothetical protein